MDLRSRISGFWFGVGGLWDLCSELYKYSLLICIDDKNNTSRSTD